MANAVEQALKRAAENTEFKLAQEMLNRNEVSLAVNNTDRVASDTQSHRNAFEAALSRALEMDKQIIEAGKSHITLIKDADKIEPQTTPSNQRPNSAKKQLDAGQQANIESIQSGQGNNYQQLNEVEKALLRQSKEAQRPESERGKGR